MDEQIKDLIEQREVVWHQAKEILARDTGEGLTKKDAADFDRLNADLERFEARIEELHELNENNKRIEVQRNKYSSIIHRDVNAGKSSMTDDKRFAGAGHKAPYQVHSSTRKLTDEDVFWRQWLKGEEPQDYIDVDFTGLEARVVNGEVEVRDLVTTTGSSAMVGTDIRNDIFEHLVAFNPLVRSGARVLNTPHGRSIQFPKSTADGTAAIVGEGTAIAEADPQFGSVTLGAWKYGQFIEVSNELIDDAEVPILDFIARNAGRALGLASGADYMTGSGTNKPRGIITAAANDFGTAVQVGSATVETDNLIDLLYSVSAPYRERNGNWYMNDATAKAIRKLKNSSDEYVWQPSAIAGQPDNLLGYPVNIAPAMASVGSANLSVGFGDPGIYQVRQAPVRFQRSDDYAFNRDVVAFRSVLRSDGDLIDAFATGFAVLDTD